MKGLMESIYEMFIFRKEDKFLNNVDPRVKFVVLLATAVPIFLSFNPLFYVFLTILLVLQTLFLANARRIAFSLKGIAKLLIMFYVIIYVFNAYPNLLNIEVAAMAFMSIFRFFLLVYSFTLFFTTTYIDDLAQVLYRLKIPYHIAYTLVLSVRFVPTVARDIAQIYDAQRSRGLELEKGNIFERIRKILPILIPAFIISILRVDFVAEALESRAFGSSYKRTFMVDLRIKPIDVIYAALILIYILTIYLFLNTKVYSFMMGWF